MPDARMPISVETMKMPPMVTSSMMMRKPQPASAPMVPASSVRISEAQKASGKSSGWPPSGAIPKSAMTIAGDDDDDEGSEREPPDQGDRAGRHRLVELVAETGAEIAALCHCPHLPRSAASAEPTPCYTRLPAIREARRTAPCGVLRNFAATEPP